MTITETIDTQISEFARAYEANATKVAERTPPPLDIFIRRIGALNAEAIRQSGHFTVTALDAANGLATVAWRGASDIAATTERALGNSADTVRTTSRRAFGDVKQATSTIANRTRNARDEIGRNFSVVEDHAEDAGAAVEREATKAGKRVVKATDTATAETGAAAANRPTGAYQNWTKEELYERAQELDIDGRSGMSKNQLVKALRS
ncbi:MAG: hypothetical protein ACSLFO_07800, partial [Acidimicrobiales bacterium]